MRPSITDGLRVVSILLWICAIGSTIAAQTNTATVTGTVTDSSGAAIPGVTVTAINTATGIQKNDTSDATGHFTILALIPGFYDVQASQQGFATVMRRHQELLVGTTVTMDFSLSVSSVSQTVDVTSDTPLLEPTQTTVQRILQTKELDSLPVLNRQFAQLAVLAPGVQSSGSSYGGTGSLTSSAISIGNSPTYQTGYIVDGLSNEATNQGFIYTSMAQDWIQEFSVISLQFPAEFGLAAGGVINTTTRSGTNAVHGRAYMFYQNAALNSNPEFFKGKNKAPFNSERPGGMVGGPIKKDKLFYFVGYEGYHNVVTNTLGSSVQNAAGGAFAATAQPVGTPPASLVPWLLYGPTTSAPVTTDSDLAMLKLDYTPNSANSFMLRGNLEFEYATNNGFGGVTTFGQSTKNFTPSYALNLGWTRTISSQTINEMRLGLFKKAGDLSTNYENGAGPYTGGVTNPYNYIDTETTFGGPTILGNPTGNIASVSYAGGAISAGGSLAIIGVEDAEDSILFTDTLTHTKGNHDIKIGGSLKRIWVYSNGGHNTFTDGRYAFASAAGPFDPTVPIPQTSGLNAALAVAPLSDAVNYGQLSYTFPSWAFGLFAQDSWKIKPNLTLNIGIRYDFNNTNSALSSDSFPALDSTIPGSHGFIQPGGHPINNDPFNIAPRIGFAWTPFQSTRTVIRGGLGIFYDQNDTASQAVYIIDNSETKFAYNLAANVPTLNPYCNGNTTCSTGIPVADEIAVVDVLAAALANRTLPQFPTSTSPCAPSSCAVTVGGNTYSVPALTTPFNPQGGEVDIAQNYKTPGTFQATIGAQHQLTNSFNFSGDFVYRRGFNGIATVNPNVALVGPGDTSNFIIVNPAFTSLKALTSGTYLKAYQLDFQAHYRDKRNDTIAVAYQLGWSWDNNFTAFAISGNNALTTNPFDFNTDYGPSALDARNILNISGTANLGWGFQLSPIFTFTSAVPYTATSSLQAPGSSAACPGYFTRCYPAGFSRDSLRGDDFISLSARFSKTFRFGESRSATLFFEGYNLTNRHNLGTNFNTNVDNPATFQQPNGVGIPLRQLQVGGRFDF
jgi:Carboxypeptidase regulatory-like domain